MPKLVQARATDRGDPCRNLCADILYLALSDIQSPTRLSVLADRTSPDAQTLLKFHSSALYYFRHDDHAYLCSTLDLDPVLVKRRALSRTFRYLEV